MKLFLDDVRTPPAFGWVVVRTADEAIEYLKTHEVYFASLDHDLADEQYPWNAIPGINPDQWEHHMDKYPMTFKEKTGYDVILWMEENDVWPSHGVKCHSMNPVGRDRINTVILKHYGHLFD
jgi:hypothetical protein